MPRHDPIPRPIPRPNAAPASGAPRGRDPRDLERAARAWARYKKMMKWMAAASIAAAILAVLFLKATGSPMKIHLVIATLAGVGLSVLLGTGLMGLVFLSDRGGHDDEAAGGGQ
jgi:hypothetical protein